MERFLPPAARSSPILSAFQHWDTSGNTCISKKQLIAVLHRLGVDADDAEKVLSRAGTADTSIMDYHQFVAYLYTSGPFDGFRLVQKQIEHERNQIDAARALASNASEEEVERKWDDGGVEADEKLNSVASALASHAYEVLPEEFKERRLQEVAAPDSKEGMAAACLSDDGPPKQMEETRENEKEGTSAEKHVLSETNAVPAATVIEHQAVRTAEEERAAAEETTLAEAAEALARFSYEVLPSHAKAARALAAHAEQHRAEEAAREADESFAALEKQTHEVAVALAAAAEAVLKAEDGRLVAEEKQLSDEAAILTAAEEVALKTEDERVAAAGKQIREETAALAAAEEAALKAEEERLAAEKSQLREETVALAAEQEAVLKAEEDARLVAEENQLGEETETLAAAKEAALKAEEEERLAAEENRLAEETAALAATREAMLTAEEERLAEATEKKLSEVGAALASFTFEILPQQREEESREKEATTKLASITAAEEAAWEAKGEGLAVEPPACASEDEAVAAEEAIGAAEIAAATSEYDGDEAAQKTHQGWDQEKAETVEEERAAEENAVSKATEHATSGERSAEEPAQEVHCASLVLGEEAACNPKQNDDVSQAPNPKKSKAKLKRWDSMSLNSTGPRALFVTVLGAKNLRNADWSWLGQGVSDPYCVCEIVGKMVGKFQTKTIDNNLNPSWNETWEVRGYAQGDELRISVYDRDSESGKNDEFLGELLLSDSLFYPDGFTGELPLEKSGNTVARLSLDIKVVMPPNEQEEEREEEDS